MQKNDGSDLSDYEIGLHQNKSMNEFSSAIMDIAKEGYGLVMISHITTKMFQMNLASNTEQRLHQIYQRDQEVL